MVSQLFFCMVGLEAVEVKQLEDFLLLARKEKLDPLVMKGSYAGAMGYGQFIPSSYLAYAIDFDGDGIRNIVTNPTIRERNDKPLTKFRVSLKTLPKLKAPKPSSSSGFIL